MRDPKHWRNDAGKGSRVLRNINIYPKQKNAKHFNLSGIKEMQHWKKINSKKEKVSETSCHPKFDLKYHGYHTLSLLEN